MENIIIAIISGLCVAVPNIIANLISNKKNNDLIKYRIDELTDKVSKHNSVIERTFRLEEKMANVEKDIAVLKNKI